MSAATGLRRVDLDAALGFALTDEQWAAVSSELTPAVIVAGAGSGKTTSMAARVAWLVASGHARPDAILGLTFTTKAAAQLLASMRASLAALERAGLLPEPEGDDAPGEPQVLTYHAFAARILAEHGIRIGREPSALLLTDARRQQLAYRVVCRTGLPLSSIGRSPATLTSALLDLDSELTELAIDPQRLRAFDDDLIATLESYGHLQNTGQALLATARERALLADLVREWRAAKAERDVIDFSDQIRLAGDIVERFPEVVDDLRSRSSVVLLDEYQDTSIAQRVLLQRIFGDGHPVTAVGDPCQAIYGWRGASVDNIERFPVHFPSGGERAAARFTLSQNRRSGPAILEVANRTSAALRENHSGVEPLVVATDVVGTGAVACGLFETHAQEVDWLVDQVLATHAARGVDAPVAWSDIAVLAATSADLVIVEGALRRRGVPTALMGAAALLAQPAVVELRSMLEVIHDPSANPAFVRLAAGPRWRIGARDLAALGDRAAHLAGGRHRSAQEDLAAALDDAVGGTDAVEIVSLSEALEDLGDPSPYSDDGYARFQAWGAELRQLRAHAGEPLADFLVRVMRTTGLEVETALGRAETADVQVHALHTFIDVASDFIEVEGRLTLGAFLSYLRDAERFDVDLDFEAAAPDDAVRLLTVHKAKGLEYPYVFVPFVSAKAFPGGSGRSSWPSSASSVPWALRDDCTDALSSFPVEGETPRDKHLKEYREVLRGLAELDDQRLAYVAFTRAMRGLVVSGHWWGPRQKTRRGPAPFLLTVRQACEDGFGTVVHWEPEPDAEAVNPQARSAAEPVAWPAPIDPTYLARLTDVAEEVRAIEWVQPTLDGAGPEVPGALTPVERAMVEEWDTLALALLEEARARHADDHRVRLPDSLSASLLMRALQPGGEAEVARDIARPMPRPPAPAARRGTQFHAWVETRFGQQSLLDPEDLPGAADDDITSDAALAALKEAFEGSAYARRTPLGVEVPFALVLGGRVVHGRIDAVFPGSGEGTDVEIVDWKTGGGRHLDPMQLAVYRLAWSRRTGVPVERIAAAFYVVGTGDVQRPDTDAALADLLALG